MWLTKIFTKQKKPPSYYNFVLEKYFEVTLIDNKNFNDIDIFLNKNKNLKFIKYIKLLEKIDNNYNKLVKYGKIKINYNSSILTRCYYISELNSFVEILKEYINDTYDNEKRRIKVYPVFDVIYIRINNE